MEDSQTPDPNSTVIPGPTRNPETLPVSNPTNPKSKPKLPLAAIVGIIFFLLLAGSAAGFYAFKPQIMKLVSKPTPTPNIVQTPTPTPDTTANWKTYDDNSLGFSFRYPKNLIISFPQLQGSSQMKSILISDMNIAPDGSVDKNSRLYEKVGGEGGTGGVIIYKGFLLRIDTTGTVSLPDELENIKSFVNNGYSIVNINGSNTYKHITNSSGGGFNGTDIRMYMIKDNIVYSIYGSYPSNKIDYSYLFDQILSTLKFTDSQTVDTSNWKNYSDDKYVISYPPDWKSDNKYGISFYSPNYNFGDRAAAKGVVVTLNDYNRWPKSAPGIVTTTSTTWLGQPAILRLITFEGNDLVLSTMVNNKYVQLTMTATSDSEREANKNIFLAIANSLVLKSTPTPTCIPRPTCLDATPRCMIAEPANGWCAK